MAVTTAQIKRGFGNNSRVTILDITGPASYTTGGEVLTAAQIAQMAGLPGGKIADLHSFDSETNTAGYTIALDRTNSKVLFFLAGAQVSNATNLSAITVRAALESFVNG